jgi:hypothetical protein
MWATIATLIAVAVIVYLLKRKSDKEIAKAAANGGLPNTYSGGNAGGNLQPGDPGYEAAVETAKGAQGPQ